MFLGNCDPVTAWEDGGLGALLMLVVGGILTWWKGRSSDKSVANR